MKYCKKESGLFILPLINSTVSSLNKETVFKDSFKDTYLKDIKFPSLDNVVILEYTSNNEEIEKFPKKIGSVHYSNNTVTYYLSIEDKFIRDYERIIQGNYSKLTENAKNNILTFWNANKTSLLYGILFKTTYAKQLYLSSMYDKGVNINNNSFEYWKKPNIHKETFKF